MYRLFLKRSFDLALSVILLSLFSPLLLILYALILTKLGYPVLFTQTRPGLHSKPFKLLKFRTMTNEQDVNGNLLSNEKRITKFGSFLRSSSLDELPELINVLKGKMSFVGPRPLRMYYIPLYDDFQNRRHEVRPGITGWAQVNGRNAISWETKFELDVWYVNNQSFLLDVKILWLTFIKVIKRENTTASDGGFTVPFRGTGSKMVSVEEVQLLKKKLG